MFETGSVFAKFWLKDVAVTYDNSISSIGPFIAAILLFQGHMGDSLIRLPQFFTRFFNNLKGLIRIMFA